MPVSSAQNANKLLCLNPYKAAVVPQLQHGLCSKTEFCELLPSLCVCVCVCVQKKWTPHLFCYALKLGNFVNKRFPLLINDFPLYEFYIILT